MENNIENSETVSLRRSTVNNREFALSATNFIVNSNDGKQQSVEGGFDLKANEKCLATGGKNNYYDKCLNKIKRSSEIRNSDIKRIERFSATATPIDKYPIVNKTWTQNTDNSNAIM